METDNIAVNNIQDVLKLIDEIEIANPYTVYIPSLQRDLKFKQLSTHQLKILYKTSLNTNILNLEFNTAFNNIIKENCLEENINTDNFTIYDKLLFFIKTRIESISAEVKFSLTDEEINTYELTDETVSVSINQHYKDFLEKKHTFDPKTFEFNNCKITCELPFLEIENKFEKELLAATVKNTSKEDLAEIVSETFLNEITKFISNLQINDVNINLKEKEFTDRIDIVKALPVTLIKHVLSYIEDYKNITNQLLTISIQINDSIIEKEIPYGPAFYNV